MSRVFISYSHDDDAHKQRVQALAARLRIDGLPVIIDADKLPGGPDEGWELWSQTQVVDADRVLIACTPTYCRRYEQKEAPAAGLGVVCEAGSIRQLLYECGGITEKFRVILFTEEDDQHVPLQLRRYHHFRVYGTDYDQLVAWLRGPAVVSAPQSTPTGKTQWPSPAPDYIWDLADRRDVFAVFEKMVTGQSLPRVLLLEGASNRGKTRVLAELMAYARHLKLDCTLLDLKGCPLLEDLIATMLLDLGPGILGGAHSAAGTARFYQLISDLKRLASPLLLVFDAYEKASEQTREWLESQLLTRLDQAPPVIVVVGGQQVPQSGKQAWSKLAQTITLQPIHQPADWLEYSLRKCPTIKPDHVQGLTLGSRGDPGLMSALLENLIQGLAKSR